MTPLKLNDNSIDIKENGYKLVPNNKYIIKLNDEKEYQYSIILSFNSLGTQTAIKNYYAWLDENGFSVTAPNPTNEVVSSYYGVKPLWSTPYSIGIVVKAEDEEDYYIVMECSSKNKGYAHTQIILTLGGCY